MKELKCPKCGNVFQVDEAEYASIVNQVRNAEFDAELTRRLHEVQERQKTEQQLAAAKVEQGFKDELGKQKLELGAKDSEIQQLKERLANIDAQKKNELDLAVLQERSKAQTAAVQIEEELAALKSALELQKKQAELDKVAASKQLEDQRRMMQEQIDYYKDLKSKMSTKMVGETLEQHCSIQYEQYLRPMMPNASFGKDNDASEGSKGDFIFRDSESGAEYVSIMFEMKNEMDETSTKHKNDDFLKKLDEDRRKKNCEFAVLVSTLEPENELYNGGIVNKSHVYPKMYVIRPQFFVSFITLLVQTSKKSLEYKKQLILAQNKDVDVTNFENKLEDFKSRFLRHCELSTKKFGDAVKQIDDAIARLQKVKESLVGTEKNLQLAGQDTEELTIRKLTYKNPTMKAKFDEARLQDVAEVVDEE